MCRFIRFHTRVRDCQIHHELGIFAALNELERECRLTEAEQDRVQEVFGWFNKNLRVPSLREEHWRARFWFWNSAQEMIGRLWEVVAILRHCDVPVELVKTNDPGTIVYGDQHQVAAIPRENRRR